MWSWWNYLGNEYGWKIFYFGPKPRVHANHLPQAKLFWGCLLSAIYVQSYCMYIHHWKYSISRTNICILSKYNKQLQFVCLLSESIWENKGHAGVQSRRWSMIPPSIEMHYLADFSLVHINIHCLDLTMCVWGRERDWRMNWEELNHGGVWSRCLWKCTPCPAYCWSYVTVPERVLCVARDCCSWKAPFAVLTAWLSEVAIHTSRNTEQRREGLAGMNPVRYGARY